MRIVEENGPLTFVALTPGEVAQIPQHLRHKTSVRYNGAVAYFMMLANEEECHLLGVPMEHDFFIVLIEGVDV